MQRINNRIFVKIIAIVCGLYLLLPLFVKPIIPILLFLYTIFNFKTCSDKTYKLLLINTLFLNFLLSLLYAHNIKFGVEYLLKCLSMPIISLFFYVLSAEYLQLFITKFKKTFVLSSVTYSFFMLLYFLYLNNKSGDFNLSIFYSYLDYEFFGFKEHPIYISVAIATAIFFLVDKPFSYKKKSTIIPLVLLIVCLMFLARKGVVLSLIFSLSILFFLTLNRKKFFLSMIGVFLIFGMSLFVPKAKMHYLELFEVNYQAENTDTSTSIRYILWNNSISLIHKHPIFGYSIGDFNDVAANELTVNGFRKLGLKKPHSHNQYIDIALATGIFGLLIFLISWTILIGALLKNKDYFSFCFFIFFFCIFMSESYLYRQNGIILFSIVSSLLIFKNLKYNSIDPKIE